MLDGIKAGCIDADELCFGSKRGPRSGREVLEPRAHRDDEVGFLGQGIGRFGARDPDRPAVARVVRTQAGLAGHCLHHGNAQGNRKVR